MATLIRWWADPDRADECLRHCMEFSQHALGKCKLDGVNRARVFDFLLEDDGCFSTPPSRASPIPLATDRPRPRCC